MNDYINFLQDSIDTSVDMKIFKNREDASVAHIFKSMLVKLPLSMFTDVDNFDPNRLKKKQPMHILFTTDHDVIVT